MLQKHFTCVPGLLGRFYISYFMYNARNQFFPNLSKTSKIKPSRSPDNPFFVFFRGGEGGGVDGDNKICAHWVLRP